MDKIITLVDGNHILYDDLLNKMATYVFVISSYETTNSTRYIYFDEIAECYGLPKDFITEDVANEIANKADKIFPGMFGDLDVLIDGDESCFSVTLYHDFAIGYIEDDQAIIENRRN